jgi:hypothetical protein
MFGLRKGLEESGMGQHQHIMRYLIPGTGINMDLDISDSVEPIQRISLVTILTSTIIKTSATWIFL